MIVQTASLVTGPEEKAHDIVHVYERYFPTRVQNSLSNKIYNITNTSIGQDILTVIVSSFEGIILIMKKWLHLKGGSST